MKLGFIARHGDSIKMNVSGYLTEFGKIDLRLAFDSYGFLIGRFETISTIEWIKRIRKTYSRSARRNALIKAIIIGSYSKLPKRFNK